MDQNKKIITLVVIINSVTLFGIHRNSFATEGSVYSPSEEASCEGKKVQNKAEIWDSLLPETLNQGDTGTCFLHSAYNRVKMATCSFCCGHGRFGGDSEV